MPQAASSTPLIPPQIAPILAAAPRLSTPVLARLGLIAVLALIAVFWATGESLYWRARRDIQTIGRDAAPSIVAAQQIRASLADLSANAANAALARGARADDAWKAYARDESNLADQLISAAQNITYGDAERIPLLTIQSALQTYEGLIGQARAVLAAAPTDGPPTEAIRVLARAQALMDKTLQPAAQALNDANETMLNAVWSRRLSGGFFDVWIAALPAAIVIFYLNQALKARTRRRFNIGLFATLALMALAALLAGAALDAASTNLKIAKVDAFDSIRAMWKARASAYIANGAESLYLLDPMAAKPQETRFFLHIAELVGGDGRKAPAQDALFFASRNCKGAAKFSGLLGDELSNVTFPGECGLAANMFATLADYLAIDAQIRALETSGGHAQAITLCVGEKPGESNHAFAKFDDALSAIIAVNQKEFEAYVARAESNIALLPTILLALTLAMAASAYFGLRRLISEYSI